MPETSIQDVIRQESRAAGIPEEIALAVAEQESDFNPMARNPTSGAIGTFQFLPSTAKTRGINAEDPLSNIRGGIGYLKELLDKHDLDLNKALAEYGGVKNDTAYVPGVLNRLQKFRPVAPAKTPADRLTPGGARPFTPVGSGDPKLQTFSPVSSHSQVGQPPPQSWVEWGTQKAKEFGENLRKEAYPLTGSVAGGLTGASLGAVGGPLGSFVGGVVGAGVGAMAGEGTQMGVETLKGQPPPSVDSVKSRLAQAGTTGMVGEAVGGALGAAASKALKPFAKSVEPYAKEAITKFKGLVLPSEVSSSRALAIGENISEASLIGGKAITETKLARQKLFEKQVLETLDELGKKTNRKNIGTALATSRNTGSKAFRAEERAVWDVAGTTAQGIPLSTPRLNQFFEQLQGAEKGSLLPNAGAEAAHRVAAMVDPVTALPGVLPLPAKAGTPPPAVVKAALDAGQFMKTVSDLGKVVRMLGRQVESDPTKAAQYGLSKKVAQLAREDLEEALSVNPAALEAYDAAKAVTLKGNREFFNDSLRALFREEGNKVPREQIVKKMVRPDNSTMIEAVKTAVGKDEFQMVQRDALAQILRKNPKTGEIDASALISRMDALGDDTLRALFPDGHDLEIRHAARLMQDLAREPAGGTGRLAAQVGQVGAGTSILTGHFGTAAATLLGAPGVMAKIMASPRGLKWLTEGLEAPRGSVVALSALRRLAPFALNPTEREAPQVGSKPPTVNEVNVSMSSEDPRARVGSPPPR